MLLPLGRHQRPQLFERFAPRRVRPELRQLRPKLHHVQQQLLANLIGVARALLAVVAAANPPFSELPRVLARLRELGKPFVVIMPCSTLTTRYFRDLFPDIQVIVPRRRIQFRKLVDGAEVPSGRCSFDCLYFCWRLELPRDVVFLT